jgi:ribosomal protein L29
MSFPPILTTKSARTDFARLPLNLTDSEAVSKTKFPSGLRPPLAASVQIEEILKKFDAQNKEREQKHFKEVDGLKCENGNLRATIADQAAELASLRAKTATATATAPTANKVQMIKMIDQEVQATEGNLSEHIEQLREDLLELRLKKKSLSSRISQQQDALSALSRASDDDNAAACMTVYMRAMQAAQDAQDF